MIKLYWGAQKGKAFDKLPNKTLEIFDDQEYFVSKKYDGNQVFIAKCGDRVRWFTSDWKEFNLPKTGTELMNITHDFVIMVEMNYDTIGKFGDRNLVQGKITTERVRFNKGLECSLDESKVHIKAFDYLTFDNRGVIDNHLFSRRIELLGLLIPWLPGNIKVVSNHLMKGSQAKVYAKELAEEGWEGCMCMKPDEYYHIGKKVNHSIKLKDRQTADLLCTGVKYSDINPKDIGSVIVQDKEGRVCAAGGLPHNLKRKDPSFFIGKIIEIKYEQIADTYIQPVYEGIRDDKPEGE